MCMVDGADYSRTFREKTARARKEHRCGECGRAIAIGENYRYTFLICEGDPLSEYTCAHYVVAQEWLQVHCGGWLYQGVGEDVAQHCEYGSWSADEERQPIKFSFPARLYGRHAAKVEAF